RTRARGRRRTPRAHRSRRPRRARRGGGVRARPASCGRHHNPCAIIRPMIGAMLRILVVGLVVLVAAMFLLPRGERGAAPEAATVLPEPRALPPVELVDHEGQPFALDDAPGEFTLLFFGF